jgi:ABC-type glycerol-3-phosphate transport system substrate-binding protein
MAVSRRSFITRLAAGGAGAAVLAACGPGQGSGPSEGAPEVKFGEPVSITFWHTQSGVNAEALDEMVRKFNSTNGKNITLKSEFQVGYTEVYQKIMASIQAGQPPDVAVAYESMVSEYMKANAVIDLEPYAIKGPLAFSPQSLADIFPAYIESNRYPEYNNKLLSFPFTKSLAVRFYNEDLFKAGGAQKYGQTGGIMNFDDFKKGLAAVSKKDASGKPTVYGENIRNDASYIDAFIYSNGGALLNNDNTKVRFNEPAGVEVYDMWGQLVQAGSAYVAQGRDYQPDFGGQKVAALHDSSTGRPFIKDFIVDKATGQERFKWGVGMIPQKDTAKPQTVMFGGNITVFRTTPIKQAASWEWIKFFMDRDQTVQFAIKSSYMPTRKSAAESADMKAHWEKEPQAKQAFDLTPYARPEPGIPAWQDIRTLLQNALTAVVTGKSTAKAALDDAANQANRLIDEKR